MGRPKAANASPAKRGSKAAKDPNRPKRATTAYFYFMADFRVQCKKDGSVDVKKVAEVTKAASEKWKNMTSGEKKPYEDKAAEDKKRYTKQMSSYVPPKGTGKVSKKASDPDKPKRPPSAYLLFLTDFRAQNSGKMSNTDIVKKGAEAWAAIGKVEKEKYEGQASSAKSKYELLVKNGGGGGAGGGAKKAAPAAKPAAAKPAAKPVSDDDDEEEEEVMEDDDDEEEAEDDDDDDDYSEGDD